MLADEKSIEAFADQKLTFALILAVCGFVLLPLIASVFAVVVAHQARGMIRDHPDYPRRPALTTALALGYVGVVYGIVVLTIVFG